MSFSFVFLVGVLYTFGYFGAIQPVRGVGPSPPHSTTFAALYNSQTSCLPSMFSFFLVRYDGIPCSVSCCEHTLPGYSRGRSFQSPGRVRRRPGGSLSLLNGPRVGMKLGHSTEQQFPEAHCTLLSVSCWSWLHRLTVPNVVYISQEWS